MAKVLALNPGGTSTKISIFDGTQESFSTNITHDWQQLKQFSGIFDQIDMRVDNIRCFLEQRGIDIREFEAVVGRGGELVNNYIPCGAYEVTEVILKDLRIASRNHEGSLGAFLADIFARQAGVKAYIVNPDSIIEAWPLATISGLCGYPKDNHFHVLSHKEVGRRAAAALGKHYEDCNLIVAHLGGGITIAAHHKGRVVDSTSGNKSTGPFSGRRAGGIRPFDLVNMCCSDGMTRGKMENILMKSGGLVSYLNTDDCIEIERRIAAGDEQAALVYEAMAYRISKEICMYTAVLMGKVDAVCLTGGMAHSEMLVGWITDHCGWVAPILNYPGTVEMEAMNTNVQAILSGQAQALVYVSES